MKTFTKLAAVASILSSVSAQSGPVIDTPSSLVQCQPVALTFHDGTAPYFISVLPGGQPSAEALVRFPEQTAAGTLTWTVDLAAGTSVSLAISDSTGAQNFAQQVTVQAGQSDSCLTSASSGATASVSVSSATGAASTSKAAAASASKAASSSAAATSKAASAASAGSSAASIAAASASTTGSPDSAASTLSTSFTVVAIAALFRFLA